MSRELIERLREAAAQRVASTAMIGAEDLSAAADALESLGAAYGGAVEAGRALAKQAFKAEQERDALAAEMKALLEQEPVARIDDDESFQGPCRHATAFVPMHRGTLLYTHPVPARYITNEAIEEMAEDFLSTDGDEAPPAVGYVEFARAIERYLKGEGK